VAVVVSCANHCYYCLVAHGQAVRQLSGDPELGEMLVMNYRAALLAETAAFFNMSNRMASATDMIPNPEYHKANR